LHAPARDTSSDEMLIRRIASGEQLAMRSLFSPPSNAIVSMADAHRAQ
jgi:hypothetical protein